MMGWSDEDNNYERRRRLTTAQWKVFRYEQRSRIPHGWISKVTMEIITTDFIGRRKNESHVYEARSHAQRRLRRYW